MIVSISQLWEPRHWLLVVTTVIILMLLKIATCHIWDFGFVKGQPYFLDEYFSLFLKRFFGASENCDSDVLHSRWERLKSTIEFLVIDTSVSIFYVMTHTDEF